MIPSITEFFSNRAYGRQFLQLFEQMAHTILEEYVDDVKKFVDQNGYSPSFEELMARVKALSDDLTMRAAWIREDYHEDRGRKSIKLTTGCKRVIHKTVEEYLRRSKAVIAIRNQPSFSFQY